MLAGALALAVFVFGPTVAIVDGFTNTLGNDVSEFVRMSLRLTPFRESTWITDWTVFYWAWWISWSPFVGMFIARVSRGRTIREFILGTVLVPSFAGFIWLSVFGATALHMEIWGLCAACRRRQHQHVDRHFRDVRRAADGRSDVGCHHRARARARVLRHLGATRQRLCSA